VKKNLSLIVSTGLALGCLVGAAVFIRSEFVAGAQSPTPIGAWFGIARPCPASDTEDSSEHAAFCRQVCGNCPSIPGTLPPEVPMMPTLLADGTVLADDAGEINRYHTTAHGKWSANSSASVQIAGRDRFDATFLWLQSSPAQAAPGSLGDLIGQLGGTCCFAAAVRPRFVTFFDAKDPDRMLGFIHLFFNASATPEKGLVKTNPPSSSDTFAGNHIPATGVDPMVTLPPCEPQNGCLGTYHFVIRRIKAF